MAAQKASLRHWRAHPAACCPRRGTRPSVDRPVPRGGRLLGALKFHGRSSPSRSGRRAARVLGHDLQWLRGGCQWRRRIDDRKRDPPHCRRLPQGAGMRRHRRQPPVDPAGARRRPLQAHVDRRAGRHAPHRAGMPLSPPRPASKCLVLARTPLTATTSHQEHRPMGGGRDLQIALAHLCAPSGRRIGPLKEPYPSPSLLDLGARLEGGPPRRLRSRDVVANRICGSRDPFLPFKGPLECLLPWRLASPWSETFLSLSDSRYRHVRFSLLLFQSAGNPIHAA